MIAVLVFFAIISVLWSRDDNFVDVMKGRNLPLLVMNEGEEVDVIEKSESTVAAEESDDDTDDNEPMLSL